MTVERTYSTGDCRYRYTLKQDGKPIRQVQSDNERRFAVVSSDMTMVLRRDVSDITDSEMADPDTRIITVTI